jgi:3-dehydroquinate synthetase
MGFIVQDKKKQRDRLRFALPVAIGKVEVMTPLDKGLIEEAIGYIGGH